MNIIVCIKQVPDVQSQVVVSKGVVSIDGLITHDIISSLDIYAIGRALKLRDKTSNGKVTLICLGTASCEASLRTGIAMGADEAILVCDPAFDKTDGYTTAYVLSKAISRLSYDLIFAGHKADDTQAGLVGPYLAHLLGLPLVRNVIALELTADKLRLTRKLEKGNREVLECPCHTLITMEAGEEIPGHASIRGVIKARTARIIKYDAADLGISSEEIRAGLRLKVTGLTTPKPRMKGLFIPDNKLAYEDKLMAIMSGGVGQRKSNMLEGDAETVSTQVIQYLKKERIIR